MIIFYYASYAIVMALLVALALFFRQSFLVMLLVIMIVLPFLSYYATKHAIASLSLKLHSASSETLKGETLPIYFTSNNTSLFPLLGIHLSFQLASAYYIDGTPISLVVGGGKFLKKPIAIPVCYKHLGLFTAKLFNAYTWDYLHLFKFDIPCDATCSIKVYPPKEAVELSADALSEEGFDEYETTQKRGNASSDVTDIREYIPGDRLQAIHWKLTAKTGDLMVKEFEATSSHQYLVLLELYKDSNNPDVLDKAITNAYNISLALISQSELFVFGFYNDSLGDFSFYKIDHEDGLTEALTNAFYAPTYDTPNLAFEIYQGSNMKMGSVLHTTEKGVFDEFSTQIY